MTCGYFIERSSGTKSNVGEKGEIEERKAQHPVRGGCFCVLEELSCNLVLVVELDERFNIRKGCFVVG